MIVKDFQFKYFLQDSDLRKSECKFCGKPYGKYRVDVTLTTEEGMFVSNFSCCNTCIPKITAENILPFFEPTKVPEIPYHVDEPQKYIFSVFVKEEGIYPNQRYIIKSDCLDDSFYLTPNSLKAHGFDNLEEGYKIMKRILHVYEEMIIPNTVAVYIRNSVFIRTYYQEQEYTNKYLKGE